MKFIKSSIVLSVVLILGSISWNGCYIQFVTNSDESEATVDSDQPPPPVYIIEPVPYPVESHPGGPYYLHPVEPPYIPPGHIGTLPPKSGTESPAASPHRQSGDQRSPNSDQSNVRRTESTPSRTSWSPAPALAPQNPPASSTSNTRTSGSTRR
jgi:hypothetical protein